MSTASQNRAGVTHDLAELLMEWWSGRPSGGGDQREAWSRHKSRKVLRRRGRRAWCRSCKAGMWDLEKGQHPCPLQQRLFHSLCSHFLPQHPLVGDNADKNQEDVSPILNKRRFTENFGTKQRKMSIQGLEIKIWDRISQLQPEGISAFCFSTASL